MLNNKAILSSKRVQSLVRQSGCFLVKNASMEQLVGMVVEYVIQKNKYGMSADDYLKQFWLMDGHECRETRIFLETLYTEVINNCPDINHCVENNEELELASVDRLSITINLFD